MKYSLEGMVPERTQNHKIVLKNWVSLWMRDTQLAGMLRHNLPSKSSCPCPKPAVWWARFWTKWRGIRWVHVLSQLFQSIRLLVCHGRITNAGLSHRHRKDWLASKTLVLGLRIISKPSWPYRKQSLRNERTRWSKWLLAVSCFRAISIQVC